MIALEGRDEISLPEYNAGTGLFPFVHFTLCEQRLERKSVGRCKNLERQPVNQNGISIYLSPAQGNVPPRSLRERPAVEVPADVPLQAAQGLAMSEAANVRSETFQIGQISSVLGSTGLKTTSVLWPLIACGADRAAHNITCTIGFRVDGMFVKATWTFRGDAEPSQRQVWQIASFIDEAVRDLKR